MQRFEVLDNQHGCIKNSWFSGDADRLPPNHFCLRAPDARLAFTSEWFNDPGYGQVARAADVRIRTLGPDDDVMGAFGFLLEAHKWTTCRCACVSSCRSACVRSSYRSPRGLSMQGDFSVLYFDPREHQRGVNPPRDGVLRNVSGVLHQQGRVMRDADLTEGELLELALERPGRTRHHRRRRRGRARRRAGGFKIEAAFVGRRRGACHACGRAARGPTASSSRLPGAAANPAAPVERLATYFGPPIANPAPTPDASTTACATR